MLVRKNNRYNQYLCQLRDFCHCLWNYSAQFKKKKKIEIYKEVSSVRVVRNWKLRWAIRSIKSIFKQSVRTCIWSTENRLLKFCTVKHRFFADHSKMKILGTLCLAVVICFMAVQVVFFLNPSSLFYYVGCRMLCLCFLS